MLCTLSSMRSTHKDFKSFVTIYSLLTHDPKIWHKSTTAKQPECNESNCLKYIQKLSTILDFHIHKYTRI